MRLNCLPFRAIICVLGCWLFIGIVLALGDAIAAPLYTASVGYPNGVDQTLTKEDATTAEASLSSSVPTSGSGSDTHNQFAAASSAGLRASARTTISATSDPGEFFGGEASSYGL